MTHNARIQSQGSLVPESELKCYATLQSILYNPTRQSPTTVRNYFPDHSHFRYSKLTPRKWNIIGNVYCFPGYRPQKFMKKKEIKTKFYVEVKYTETESLKTEQTVKNIGLSLEV